MGKGFIFPTDLKGKAIKVKPGAIENFLGKVVTFYEVQLNMRDIKFFSSYREWKKVLSKHQIIIFIFILIIMLNLSYWFNCLWNDIRIY